MHCPGHLVSGYVKQHLPIILVNHLTTERDVTKALAQGFVEVNNSLQNSRIDCEFSGSTAVVSYLKVRCTCWVVGVREHRSTRMIIMYQGVQAWVHWVMLCSCSGVCSVSVRLSFSLSGGHYWGWVRYDRQHRGGVVTWA